MTSREHSLSSLNLLFYYSFLSPWQTVGVLFIYSICLLVDVKINLYMVYIKYNHEGISIKVE